MLYLLLIAILIIIMLLVVHFTRLVIYPKNHTHDYIESKELEQEAYDPDLLESFDSRRVHIPSIFDYNLTGRIYLQDNPRAPFVLICHGITVNYEASKKYTSLFLKKGYSVLVYDHRNHGYNDPMHTSLGYFEKFDAQGCIDYIYHNFQPKHVGIMGESMGAATALQLAAMDDRLAFCIEDCGYSDAYQLIKHRAHHDHNIIIAQLVVLSNFFIKKIFKWSFKDVSIIHNINDIKCPILFIHGEDDDYVPYKMVHEMHQAFKGKSMLYTVPKAKHAMAYKTDKIKYEAILDDFLEMI